MRPLPITKVVARNFKKQTFSFEFSAPVTVFTGENSTGKTARVEALSLALLGYVPDEKPLKAERAIFDAYASGSTMSVSVEGVATVPITRQYLLDGGSVKYSGPKGSVVPAVVLDAGAYLTKTGAERTNHLFREFAGDIDAAAFLAEVASALKGAVTAEHGPKIEAAARAIAGNLQLPAPGQPFQEWLDVLLAEAKEAEKRAKQNLKRMSEAVRADTQVADTESPPQNAEELVAKARAELSTITTAVSNLQQQLDRCRADWREAKAAAANLAAFQQLDVAALEAAVQGAIIQPAHDRVDEAVKSRDAQNQVLSGQTAELRMAQETLRKLESAKNCPTCGQDITALNEARLKKARKSAETLESDAASTRKLVDKASELVTAAEADYAQAKAAYDRYAIAVKELSEARRQKSAMAAFEPAAATLPKHEADGRRINNELTNKNLDQKQAAEVLERHEADFRRSLAFRAAAAARIKLEDELETATHQATACTLLVKVLQAKLEAVVEKAIQPLVSTMNRLCSPILPSPVTFADGELLLGGHTHRSSSDSEKLLIYAALCVALASKSPLKVVVIGRLESFDWRKRPALVGLLLDLIKAGTLDQAILVGVQTSATPDSYAFGPELVEVVVPGKE